jgi:hypothetical protein
MADSQSLAPDIVTVAMSDEGLLASPAIATHGMVVNKHITKKGFCIIGLRRCGSVAPYIKNCQTAAVRLDSFRGDAQR